MASKPNEVKKPEAAPVKAEIKPGELEKLFKSYFEADKAVRALEENLERTIAARSDAVKAIGAIGTGPYEVNGRLLTVTSRKNEEAYKTFQQDGMTEPEAKDAATRFFFKSTGEQTITKVGKVA